MGTMFPLGPFHPALAEPVATRLRLRGERVTGVAPLGTGYSYRGALGLAVDLPLDDALVILERVCARAGQSYRLALCLAVERVTHVEVSRPAQLMRTLFAELERLHSALWTLGEMARGIDQRGLWAQALEHREQVFEAASEATGERVFWGVALPGGVRSDLKLEPVRAFAEGAPTIYAAWQQETVTGGALRRATERMGGALETASDAAPESASEQSGSPSDARRATPYDAYRLLSLDWTPLEALNAMTLDVATKASRLVAGMKLSVDIIATCLEELDGEPGLAAPSSKLVAGEGAAKTQSSHGRARAAVTLDGEGTVKALTLETVCAAPFTRAPELLAGRAVAEAPALLAALDLCPSCAEL